MAWHSSVFQQQNTRRVAGHALRSAWMLGLIVAMLMNTLWASARQFQGLAHQHEPSLPRHGNHAKAMATSVDMLRLGFQISPTELASLPPSMAHQHAQTGYHVHLTSLKDIVTRWLYPDAHDALAYDTAQDNAFSQGVQFALLPTTHVFPSKPVQGSVADFTTWAYDDAFQRRLERPPSIATMGFKKPVQS